MQYGALPLKSVDPVQPIVILGGFLIAAEAYKPMAAWLKLQGVSDVLVVPMTRLDWLLTTGRFGWRRVLDRVDSMVKQVQHQSPSGKATLIGHSSGGVMLRLYLSKETFEGIVYAGSERCDRLITLGSPHQAVRATPLRAMVDRRLPGCYESGVDYVAIAGKLELCRGNASALSRIGAKASYKRAINNDGCLGDGLVPVESALLHGARSLIQNDTAHGGLFGDIWYASTQRVDEWWNFVVNSESSEGNRSI